MRRSVLCLFVGVMMAIVGCSEDRMPAPTTPANDSEWASTAEMAARAFVEEAGWPVEASEAGSDRAVPQRQGGNIPIAHFQRTPISGDIVHYSVVVRTGPGEYDKVGIHRVVRETRPYVPIRTEKSLFMLHGDLKRFETMFIPGQFAATLPNDFGIAVYLAQNDVDVWGIDQGWNFVPAEETNFSFFADWGVQKEVDHLEIGLGIARISRLVTGNGLDTMLLLGYSSGAVTGYALLNQESQWPRARRQVKGFIAADAGVRTDDDDWAAVWSEWSAGKEDLYSSGQYQDPLTTRDTALRAKTDPDGPSPYAPGFTNLQFALYLGGGLVFSTPEIATNAHYHAPILDGSGLPVDFQFITVDQWLDFLENTAAYEPIRFEADYTRLFAGQPSPFVEHLGDITVPVLDIGGAGGIAPYMAATTDHLGSDDIVQLHVSVGAPEVALDYGHIDIFTASNAPTLVWQPILQWIFGHSD